MADGPSNKSLLRLALLALGLYLIWRVWSGASSTASNLAPTADPTSAEPQPGNNGGQLPGLQPPDPPAVVAGIFNQPAVDVGDVAGDVSNTEPDFWLTSYDFGDPDPAKQRTRVDRFYRQVYLPASQVPVTALGSDDYKLAMRLLAGQLDDKNCPLSDGEQRTNDLFNNDGIRLYIQVAGAIITAVVGAIVTVFAGAPAGAAVAAAIQAGVQAGYQAIPASIDVSKLAPKAGLQSQLLRWLGPVVVVGQRFPKDGSWDQGDALASHLDGGGPYDAYSVRNTAQGAQLWSPSVAGTVAVPFYPRWALFSRNVSRFDLQWNSVELGCQKTLRDRVNIRARVYRALDVMACLMFPNEDQVIGPHGEITWEQPDGLYVYQSGKGLLAGSIFPPGPGDQPIPNHTTKAPVVFAIADPSLLNVGPPPPLQLASIALGQGATVAASSAAATPTTPLVASDPTVLAAVATGTPHAALTVRRF